MKMRAGVLIFGFLVSSPLCAEDLTESFRHPDRKPGLYFVDANNGDRTTTSDPVAPLDSESIRQALDLETNEYAKIVLIGAPLLGPTKKVLADAARETLDSKGLKTEVVVMRHPHGFIEKAMNVLPRREDWERPEPSELKVSVWTQIVVGEAVTTAILLLPPLTQISKIDIGTTLNEFFTKISLPLHIGVPLVVLNYAHLTLFAVPARFWSNHNIRLSPQETLARQFLLSVFFSTNFYLVSRYPEIWEGLMNFSFANFGEASLTFLQTILPASIFNTLARTSVHKSIHLWEHKGANRKVARAYLEGAASWFIGIPYVLSTLPLFEPMIRAPLMDLNALHLYLLSVGVMGGGTWIALQPPKILKTCSGALRSMLHAVKNSSGLRRRRT